MNEGRSEATEATPRQYAAPEVGSSSAPAAAAPSDSDGARLGTEVEAVIGRRLKALYDDVVNEAVPDRFMQLLAQLEQVPRSGGDGSENGR